MRFARSMFAAGTDNNVLIVAGGINEEKNEIGECEIFDIKQNLWT